MQMIPFSNSWPGRGLPFRTALAVCATVWSATGLWATPEGAPSVSVAPASQTVLAGATATFTATADGAAPLSFQWYWSDSVKLEGATNSTLTITNVSASHAGTYLVRLTNASGSASSAPSTLIVNSPPTVEKPSDQNAFTGQDVTFTASVTGTPPLSFQWVYTNPGLTNATVLTNATSQSLTLTNLSIFNNGKYALVVSNAFGVTTSSNATLVVYNRPQPALSFGVYSSPAVAPGTGDVSVPVYYAANGSETNLSFSFSYDPAVLTNATFNPLIFNDAQTICACSVISLVPGAVEAISTNGPNRGGARPAALVANTQVFEDRSQTSTGRLGIKVVLPAGVTFSPDYSNHIGVLSFNLVPGATNPFAGRVEFGNAPSALQFLPNLFGNTTPFIHPVVPNFVAGGPTFNRQSGLVEQTLDITNPGDFTENVRVQVYGLGVDSRTNAVRLNNAIGSTVIGTNVVPVADLGAFGPGETRRAVLEYFVSDRRPQSVTPSIELRVVPAAVVTPSGTQLGIHNYRFTNGVFLVEFPTRSGYRYYVQYAATVTGTNQPSFKTSLPPVVGTGNYVQWLDNGPPKTDTLPTNGMRLYRLIETR